MTSQNILRNEVRAGFKQKFRDAQFNRVIDGAIVNADDARLLLAFSCPQGEHAVRQSWGHERWDLRSIACQFRSGAGVGLDHDKAKNIAALHKAEFVNGCLVVWLQYPTAEAYADAKEAGTARIELCYLINQWEYESPSDLTIRVITLKEVGLLSSTFAVKQPKRRRRLAAEPAVCVRPVRFDSPGRQGNVTVDAAARTVTLEFVDSNPFDCEGENEKIALSGSVRLQPLVGTIVYPCVDGKPVKGALPVGRVASVVWDGIEIYDEDFSARNNGARKSVAFGNASILFNSTPAGDAALADFAAGKNMSTVLLCQTQRSMRELERGEYVKHYISWEPLSLGIEGATVTIAETPAAAAPELANKPGLLSRIATAITGARGEA